MGNALSKFSPFISSRVWAQNSRNMENLISAHYDTEMAEPGSDFWCWSTVNGVFVKTWSKNRMIIVHCSNPGIFFKACFSLLQHLFSLSLFLGNGYCLVLLPSSQGSESSWSDTRSTRKEEPSAVHSNEVQTDLVLLLHDTRTNTPGTFASINNILKKTDLYSSV